VVKDSFAGDEVASLSGIMNGTSNYVLSKMQTEDLSFQRRSPSPRARATRG
jgi:homoserine dehydrogenase